MDRIDVKKYFKNGKKYFRRTRILAAKFSNIRVNPSELVKILNDETDNIFSVEYVYKKGEVYPYKKNLFSRCFYKFQFHEDEADGLRVLDSEMKSRGYYGYITPANISDDKLKEATKVPCRKLEEFPSLSN